jgi:hypothetical protein
MKKLLCLLVVCILTIAGSGVIAIGNKNSEINNTEPKLPGQVKILIKGGFGITVRLKSSILMQNTGKIHIFIGGALNNKGYNLELPDPIPPDDTIILRTGLKQFIFGVGPCLITIIVTLYDNSQPAEGQFVKYGLVLGPFILMFPIVTTL